jgi:hypothetical protein
VKAQATRNTPKAMNMALNGISRRALIPRYVRAPEMTTNDRPISASEMTCNVSSGQPQLLPSCGASAGAAARNSDMRCPPRA